MSGIKNEFEIHDKRFLYLILGNTWVERLYTGSLGRKGRVYFADGDYLLWSDIPNNRMLDGLAATRASTDFFQP